MRIRLTRAQVSTVAEYLPNHLTDYGSTYVDTDDAPALLRAFEEVASTRDTGPLGGLIDRTRAALRDAVAPAESSDTAQPVANGTGTTSQVHADSPESSTGGQDTDGTRGVCSHCGWCASRCAALPGRSSCCVVCQHPAASAANVDEDQEPTDEDLTGEESPAPLTPGVTVEDHATAKLDAVRQQLDELEPAHDPAWVDASLSLPASVCGYLTAVANGEYGEEPARLAHGMDDQPGERITRWVARLRHKLHSAGYHDAARALHIVPATV